MKIRFYSMKIQITFIFAIFKKLACKLIAEFLLNSYALSENCCKYFLCKQKNKGTTSKAPFHRKINGHSRYFTLEVHDRNKRDP